MIFAIELMCGEVYSCIVIMKKNPECFVVLKYVNHEVCVITRIHCARTHFMRS